MVQSMPTLSRREALAAFTGTAIGLAAPATVPASQVTQSVEDDGCVYKRPVAGPLGVHASQAKTVAILELLQLAILESQGGMEDTPGIACACEDCRRAIRELDALAMTAALYQSCLESTMNAGEEYARSIPAWLAEFLPNLAEDYYLPLTALKKRGDLPAGWSAAYAEATKWRIQRAK